MGNDNLLIAAKRFLELRIEIFPEVRGAHCVQALQDLEDTIAEAEKSGESGGDPKNSPNSPVRGLPPSGEPGRIRAKSSAGREGARERELRKEFARLAKHLRSLAKKDKTAQKNASRPLIAVLYKGMAEASLQAATFIEESLGMELQNAGQVGKVVKAAAEVDRAAAGMLHALIEIRNRISSRELADQNGDRDADSQKLCDIAIAEAQKAGLR